MRDKQRDKAPASFVEQGTISAGTTGHNTEGVCMPIDFSLLEAQPASFNDDVTYLRQHARAFLEAVNTREQLAAERVLPLPLGTWNAPFVFEPAGVVVKLSPWNDRFEADFLQSAARVSPAIPRLLGYGELPDERLPNACYVVMEYITGAETAGARLDRGELSQPQRDRLASALGGLLARIHTIPMPSLRAFEQPLADWGAAFGLWELRPTSVFDDVLLPRFEQALRQTRYRERTDAMLTHSDANLHNVLVDTASGALRALIDPGPVIGGDTMYDLAYAAQPWNYGHSYLEHLLATYQAAGGAFEPERFYAALLSVAYLQNRDHHPHMPHARAYLETHVFPQLERADD